jgi:hypothetical protein
MHAATVQTNFPGKPGYLFLRKEAPFSFVWYKEFEKTSVVAQTIEEALRLGRNFFHQDGFQSLNCGLRLPLPERDEHGSPALFHQMASSYSSPNGIYFDEDLGSLCIVQNAPTASRELLKKWEQEGRF